MGSQAMAPALARSKAGAKLANVMNDDDLDFMDALPALPGGEHSLPFPLIAVPQPTSQQQLLLPPAAVATVEQVPVKLEHVDDGAASGPVTTPPVQKAKSNQKPNKKQPAVKEEEETEEEEEEEEEEVKKEQQGGEGGANSQKGPSKKSSSTEIKLEDLKKLFHLPREEAAEALGISTSCFKRQCRVLNIDRWPHRKFASLDTLAKGLEGQRLGPQQKEELRQLIEEERQRLYADPNSEINPTLLKQRVNGYKQRYHARKRETEPSPFAQPFNPAPAPVSGPFASPQAPAAAAAATASSAPGSGAAAAPVAVTARWAPRKSAPGLNEGVGGSSDEPLSAVIAVIAPSSGFLTVPIVATAATAGATASLASHKRGSSGQARSSCSGPSGSDMSQDVAGVMGGVPAVPQRCSSTAVQQYSGTEPPLHRSPKAARSPRTASEDVSGALRREAAAAVAAVATAATAGQTVRLLRERGPARTWSGAGAPHHYSGPAAAAAAAGYDMQGKPETGTGRVAGRQVADARSGVTEGGTDDVGGGSSMQASHSVQQPLYAARPSTPSEQHGASGSVHELSGPAGFMLHARSLQQFAEGTRSMRSRQVSSTGLSGPLGALDVHSEPLWQLQPGSTAAAPGSTMMGGGMAQYEQQYMYGYSQPGSGQHRPSSGQLAQCLLSRARPGHVSGPPTHAGRDTYPAAAGMQAGRGGMQAPPADTRFMVTGSREQHAFMDDICAGFLDDSGSPATLQCPAAATHGGGHLSGRLLSSSSSINGPAGFASAPIPGAVRPNAPGPLPGWEGAWATGGAPINPVEFGSVGPWGARVPLHNGGTVNSGTAGGTMGEDPRVHTAPLPEQVQGAWAVEPSAPSFSANLHHPYALSVPPAANSASWLLPHPATAAPASTGSMSDRTHHSGPLFSPAAVQSGSTGGMQQYGAVAAQQQHASAAVAGQRGSGSSGGAGSALLQQWQQQQPAAQRERLPAGMALGGMRALHELQVPWNTHQAAGGPHVAHHVSQYSGPAAVTSAPAAAGGLATGLQFAAQLQQGLFSIGQEAHAGEHAFTEEEMLRMAATSSVLPVLAAPPVLPAPTRARRAVQFDLVPAGADGAHAAQQQQPPPNRMHAAPLPTIHMGHAIAAVAAGAAGTWQQQQQLPPGTAHNVPDQLDFMLASFPDGFGGGDGGGGETLSNGGGDNGSNPVHMHMGSGNYDQHCMLLGSADMPDMESPPPSMTNM